MLERYLTEIEKLETEGRITVRHHALLRSSPNAYSALVSLTQGDERHINEETITETLRRTEEEIAADKDVALGRERAESERWRNEVYARRDALVEARRKEYWRCDRIAHTVEKGVTTMILSSTVLGFLGSVWWFLRSVPTASHSEMIGLGGSVLLGGASVMTAVVSVSQRTKVRTLARKLLLRYSGRYQVINRMVKADED